MNDLYLETEEQADRDWEAFLDRLGEEDRHVERAQERQLNRELLD